MNELDLTNTQAVIFMVVLIETAKKAPKWSEEVHRR